MTPLKECTFFSSNDRDDYECHKKFPLAERVVAWHPLPKRSLNKGNKMDKEIRHIEKKGKGVVKDLKKLEKEDKKRDKECKYGEKMMKKKR